MVLTRAWWMSWCDSLTRRNEPEFEMEVTFNHQMWIWYHLTHWAMSELIPEIISTFYMIFTSLNCQMNSTASNLNMKKSEYTPGSSCCRPWSPLTPKIVGTMNIQHHPVTCKSLAGDPRLKKFLASSSTYAAKHSYEQVSVQGWKLYQKRKIPKCIHSWIW